MMRVAFVARYLQMVNHHKVIALAAQPGIDLWHIAPRRWKDNFRVYEQELKQGQDYRLLIADLFPLRSDIHRFIYWPPTLFLNRIRPDILHIEEEPDSLAALQAGWARRLWSPRAKLILFSWQNIRRKRRAAVEQIARFVLRRVDHAIAGNHGAADVLRQQGYLGPITVLPQLGVDTSVFQPRDGTALRDELQLGHFVIGYVGRFVPEKGLEVLIEAAARVPGCHVLLIGRGPMQAEIESLATARGLQNRLTIIPPVPHHDVARYFNAMDVLVLPSRTTPVWQEQFGHVLIEAMACGLPVIGSDSGAIPEVIGAAGLIFPENDVNALTDQLRRLEQDRDTLRRLSQLGLERVSAHYTHERIAEQTLRVYRSVL